MYDQQGYDKESVQANEGAVRRNLHRGLGFSFKKEYLAYSKEVKQHPAGSSFSLELAESNPLLKEAYEFLGDQKVESLRYKETTIRDLVYFYRPETQAALKEELELTFKVKNKYALKEAKRLLGLCYQKLKINIAPKASILKEHFEIKTVKVLDPINSHREDGIEIESLRAKNTPEAIEIVA